MAASIATAGVAEAGKARYPYEEKRVVSKIG